MPNGNRYKRRKKKPYYKRRKKNYRERTMVSRISPVPSTFLTKLTYCQSIELDATATEVPVYHGFRANNILDPDFTGVGHSCLGYDQIKLMYNHWYVLGSKITVDYIMTSVGATTGNAICGIAVSDGSSPNLEVDTWREQPRIVTKIITGATQRTRLTKTFSAKNFFGGTNVMDKDELKGGIATNPSEQAYFHVLAGSVGNGEDPAVVICDVKINFIVMFAEPNELAQSG